MTTSKPRRLTEQEGGPPNDAYFASDASPAAQRGRANRDRGHRAERDVVRWLRDNGFPSAERAVRTGYRTASRVAADPGDITGTGPVLWSVKDCARERIDAWMDELDAMSDDSQYGGVSVPLLVVKRRGHADPGRWWCWLWQGQYLDLYRTWLVRSNLTDPYDNLPLWTPTGTEYPLRMELGHVMPLLLAAGYGEQEQGPTWPPVDQS